MNHKKYHCRLWRFIKLVNLNRIFWLPRLFAGRHLWRTFLSIKKLSNTRFLYMTKISTTSWGRLNIKMPSYQYRKDKTVSPTVLSLTWESPYLGKTVFILRQGPSRCQLSIYWTVWELVLIYRKISNIRRAKSLNLNVSRPNLQMSLRNILEAKCWVEK